MNLINSLNFQTSLSYLPKKLSLRISTNWKKKSVKISRHELNIFETERKHREKTNSSSRTSEKFFSKNFEEKKEIFKEREEMRKMRNAGSIHRARKIGLPDRGGRGGGNAFRA